MASPPDASENDLIANRLKKAEEARKRLGEGTSWPDADAFRPSMSIAAFRRKYEEMDAAALEGLPAGEHTHRLAGRAMLFREFGGGAFAPLRDGTGQVQLFFSKKDLESPELFELLKLLDNGDFVGAEGVPMRTKKGELSLKVKRFRPVSKTVRPLPEKFHGLTDKETRYRQRYVDLIANPDVADVFRKRAFIVRRIRNFLEEKGLLEVETPMMHPLAGGAAARPFVTHHNALDMQLYMRIAPELYLKRLVVGGLDGVFEINRNFRNEGISLQHNPEFTMLEFYVAYRTYRDLMDWTEEMIAGLVQELHGTTDLEYHYDLNDREKVHRLSFAKPWRRTTVHDAVAAAAGVARAGLDTLEGATTVYREKLRGDEAREKLEAVLRAHGASPAGDAARVAAGHVVYALFEALVEPTLIQPTFVHDFPIAVSPLARRSDKDPAIADRFELFIAGREIANAFSELNDPHDQEARFRAQVEAKKAGDDEAMPYDADYVRALEYGLPPTAGEGIGIDRLCMILTDQASIRDVILFPLMRPEAR